MTQKNSFSFPEVRLLKASAGSGKTYQLTKRYVQLLFITCRKDPGNLKEVLAITFTNKAAQEMKARILEFLKKASLNQLQDWEVSDVLTPIQITPSEASILSTQLMDYILRSYHYFAVQTIDSFVNTLLAGCAFKIGLSAKFRIARNSYDYLQLGLDELLLQAQHDKHTHLLFDNFIKQYLFLENRGSWLPKEELLKTLSSLYSQANTYGLPLKESIHDNEHLRKDKRKFYDILARIHSQAPAGMHKRFAESLSNFVKNSGNGFDVDDLSDYLAREEFPQLKSAEIPVAIHDQWEQARVLLNEICLEEAFGVFNPYIKIYHELMVNFLKLQEKDDVLFLEQLNQKAKSLFDGNLITVGELYYRLAARFHHYLIDEFQDTNRMQWSNLRLMIDEALSSDGSLFLVGDVKQAIYGFRGGDSQLFDHIADEYPSLVTHQTLDINRRSQRMIIEFNNQIFSKDNLINFIQAMRLKTEANILGEDEARYLNVFEHAKQTWRVGHDQGYVKVVNVLGKSEERMQATYEQFIETLIDVRRRFKLGEIAVLVRSNTQVEIITSWLMNEDIAVESERTSDIQQHPLIMELLSFLRFVYNPQDKISFATFLLGQIAPKIFGVPHEELASVCFTKRATLIESFKQDYPKQWQECVAEFIDRIGQYPLYELMVHMYRCFRLQESFPESLGFLMHFLEIIKRKEEQSVDVGLFLDSFENLEDEFRFIPVPKADAIRVLTVHKAKGLEFPVVILPFLEMPLKVGAGGREGHQSFSMLMDEDSLSLVRLKKTYAQFSAPLKRLWDFEYKKSLLNELCAMYVALTRAVWEMYIFIPEKSGNAYNPALALIPQDQWEKGQVNTDRIESNIVSSQVTLLSPLPLNDWMPLLREDFGEDTQEKKQARFKGELWHQALALITRFDQVQDIPNIAKEVLISVIRMRGLSDQVSEEYLPQFFSFLSRADVITYFQLPTATQVYCEMDFVNRYGDLNRVDRLLVSTDKVMVIDFKSSKQDAIKHQDQIDNYVQSLKAIYPKHHIEGRLIYF